MYKYKYINLFILLYKNFIHNLQNKYKILIFN